MIFSPLEQANEIEIKFLFKTVRGWTLWSLKVILRFIETFEKVVVSHISILDEGNVFGCLLLLLLPPLFIYLPVLCSFTCMPHTYYYSD